MFQEKCDKTGTNILDSVINLSLPDHLSEPEQGKGGRTFEISEMLVQSNLLLPPTKSAVFSQNIGI